MKTDAIPLQSFELISPSLNKHSRYSNYNINKLNHSTKSDLVFKEVGSNTDYINLMFHESSFGAPIFKNNPSYSARYPSNPRLSSLHHKFLQIISDYSQHRKYSNNNPLIIGKPQPVHTNQSQIQRLTEYRVHVIGESSIPEPKPMAFSLNLP